MATVNVQALLAVAVGGGDFDPYYSVVGSITPNPLSINLTTSAYTIPVPAGSVGAIVFPPAGSAIVLKSKTVLGDTGAYRPQGTPWIEQFDPINVPANLYIVPASNTVGNTLVWFF